MSIDLCGEAYRSYAKTRGDDYLYGEFLKGEAFKIPTPTGTPTGCASYTALLLR
jgi:hypothetical protein